MTEYKFGTWYPIEEAPKDGSSIIAMANEYTDPFVVFWGNYREGTGDMPGLPDGSVIQRDWILTNIDTDDYSLLYAPTHWTPLPPPPTDKE